MIVVFGCASMADKAITQTCESGGCLECHDTILFLESHFVERNI